MDKPDPMDVKSSYDGSVSIGTPIDGHLFVFDLVVEFEIAVVLENWLLFFKFLFLPQIPMS